MNLSNRTIYVEIVIALALFWSSLAYLAYWLATSHPKLINCSMAEFQPDFTPEMRKACRELRSHKL